jgi:serine/threonine protein kinase
MKPISFGNESYPQGQKNLFSARSKDVSYLHDFLIARCFMFERYGVIKWVGGGAYADVYKARDLMLGSIVAKKELRVPNQVNWKRFRREKEMLEKYASSAYFANLLDSDLNSPALYLILEFSEHGSLQQFVGKIHDWRQGARWLIDMAHGAEAVWEQGDKHRDIKPGNLLLCSDGNGGEIVKFTDFGLAHRMDNPSGPMTNSVYGTEGYIDPVAERTGIFFPQSDIYAIGRTMRALFTGHPGGMILRMVPGPVEFRNLIDRMTDLDITKRPTPKDIYQTCERLLAVPEMPPLQLPKIDWKGAALFGGLALAFIAANANTFDEKMGRYRNSRGQFASGWLF